MMTITAIGMKDIRAQKPGRSPQVLFNLQRLQISCFVIGIFLNIFILSVSLYQKKPVIHQVILSGFTNELM